MTVRRSWFSFPCCNSRIHRTDICNHAVCNPQFVQKQRDAPPGAAGPLPPPMAWRDGITLQEAQAALVATVNAMYVIPSGDASLGPQEHLAAIEKLCDGGSGERFPPSLPRFSVLWLYGLGRD